MAGFGEELRFEREGRGVSLEALSAETKVQANHFKALERGEFHELPGGVFRRGILRAYLKALDLDEQDWMPRFEASVTEHAQARGETVISGDEAWGTFASNVKKNRSSLKRGTRLRWVGVAGLLVVVVLTALILWHFEFRDLLGR
jgi:cytoskeleton protein RodZ